MSRTKFVKANLTVAAMAIAATTLVSTVGASAQSPTRGRIQAKETARNQQYFQCAEFSQRVFSACLEQAGNQSTKIRSCRAHYHGNLARCRASTG